MTSESSESRFCFAESLVGDSQNESPTLPPAYSENNHSYSVPTCRECGKELSTDGQYCTLHGEERYFMMG